MAAHRLPKPLDPRDACRVGHHRWDIENGSFNTLMAFGLDHCFKHQPTAIVNFVLTLLIVYVLLQCFWQRNLKPPLRSALTLVGLAQKLYQSVVLLPGRWRSPWWANPSTQGAPPGQPP
jgi:hypothetical protein